MSCLFCGTDLCTCNEKILDRYFYLTDLITQLRVFNSTHTLSESEKKVWGMMYDQAKEEQRKSKLLITFEPYKKSKPKKTKNTNGQRL